jgi:two-component system phosphate regulon sensor histidine kinase PhoR
MKISLVSRIFLGFLVIILMFAGLTLILFSSHFRSIHRQMLADHLETLAAGLAAEAEPMLKGERYQDLQDFVRKTGNMVHTRITFIDGQGQVLADSEESPESMENHRNRPEVAEALRGRRGVATRFSSTMNKEALYVALPLSYEDKGAGALRASLYLRDIALPSRLKTGMLTIAGVLTFLALLAATLIARSLSRPIRQLTDAAQKTASGDFSTKLFLRRSDELRVLADSFNRMNDEMARMFRDLRRQKEQVLAIVESLREPLFVIDSAGRIMYVNNSLKKLAAIDSSTEGKFYWQAIRQPLIIEMIEKGRGQERGLTDELNIDGRTFLFSVTPVGSGQEMVALLHEITDRRQVEKVKKDLVVNVSHELRTPLTSIKGFAETLEEVVDEKSRRYVEIIKRNTDRLINIVNDLLLLSKLGEGSKLELEDIDLIKLTEGTGHIFENQLRQKHLSLEIEAAPDVPHIKGDSYRLEQMLINLLDNAVKYTEKGRICVNLRLEGKKLALEIADSGIGIPSEDLGRVFERFYVVDKSRSRRLGGTGLGLSIVKHIVLAHNGEIDLKSSLGKGTRVIVRLPLDPG